MLMSDRLRRSYRKQMHQEHSGESHAKHTYKNGGSKHDRSEKPRPDADRKLVAGEQPIQSGVCADAVLRVVACKVAQEGIVLFPYPTSADISRGPTA